MGDDAVDRVAGDLRDLDVGGRADLAGHDAQARGDHRFAGDAGVSYSTSKLRTVKGGAKPPKGMRIDAVVDVDPVPAVAYVALTSSAAVVPVPEACQLQAAVGGGILALANMSCGAGEAVVGFDAAGDVLCEPFNTFVRRGPATNVEEADLVSWSECYQHTFAGAPADNILTDVMTTCTGAEILLACRPVGDTKFDVVAHAPRADVVFDTTTDDTTTHHANGTEWYFSAVESWGFAGGGDAVNKIPCDIVNNPADPDSSYNKHRGQGYLTQVMETYQEDDALEAEGPPQDDPSAKDERVEDEDRPEGGECDRPH